MTYSLVVPLYNEEGNIKLLHKKIIETMISLSSEFEVIFVDDCSSDATREIGKTLSPLMFVELQKNSGQTAAMDAGIKTATGKYIITMDGDLQNDPADIPRLIKHLEDNNLDCVSGWRKKRNDPFMKRFVSRGAYLLRQILLSDGIHDSGCSLKIYKRECFASLDLYGEMHRFIPALLKIKGYTIGEIEVSHHARTSGVTKYNWKRTIKGLLDMGAVWFWKKYSARPLHLLGGIGIIFFLLGFGSLGVSIFQKLVMEVDFSGNGLVILSLFSLFFGLLFLLLGMLFDVMIKIYYQTGNDSSYIIETKHYL